MHEDRQTDADFEANLPEELKSFAGQLNQFRAKSASSDRDRILFEAGRSAAQAELDRIRASHRIRVWQTAAIVLFAVSIGLGTRIGSQNQVEPQIASNPTTNLPVVATLPSTSVPVVSTTSDVRTDLPSHLHPARKLTADEIQAIAIEQGIRNGEELRARQSRLNDAFASINGIDRRPSNAMEAPPTVGDGSPSIPEWKHRGLRRDEQIREFIHQLTQESNL